MDDLPELPFEQVLSYLNLEDRLKARAVSRRWYHKINSFKVNTLCYSNRKREFIYGKNRWVSGSFAKNFINSNRFASFFDTFGQTILSSLKRLRLCDLDLNERGRAAFTRTLNSFVKLEELDIIRTELNQQDVLNLNLPVLTSLHLENVDRIIDLTLKAPRLRDVKILNYYRADLSVEIVHGESVERLLVDCWEYTEVKKLKNLQYLYIPHLQGINSTFLSRLQHLKEIHTTNPDVSWLFEQKQRSGRADLKIYLCGLLLNGPHDPAINAYKASLGEWFACLAENRSRWADQIPFYSYLHYSDIKGVAPGLVADLLKLFTDLNEVEVQSRVEDIERFLNILKNCKDIVELRFYWDQPQDLFDRLPEHCAIQKLFINGPQSDLAFLFRLKHLIHLSIGWSIDIETVRRAFDELPALRFFSFKYGQKRASIVTVGPKQLEVKVKVNYIEKTVSDLNAAIEVIFGKEKPSRPNKRTAEALE